MSFPKGLYKLADSDVWWTSITVNGERIRRSTETYDVKEALKFRDKLKAQRHDAPVLKGKKWSTAVMKWAEEKTRSDSDLQSMAKFAAHYPDRLLSSVSKESLDKALKSFIKTNGTYNRYLSRIVAILNFSGVNLHLKKRDDDEAVERDYITHAQWDKLYAELPQHLKCSALFAVSTGLRQANVLGLTWDHVDTKRHVAWVERVDTKSKRSALSVPLNPKALAALEAVAGLHPEFVFTYRGQPYAEIKTAFQAACIRAGVGRIDTRTEGKVVRSFYSGFTWHGLRHTWASWHVQNGTPLEVLQKLGGWADLRMVMRYAKFSPGFVAGYADNIGADLDRKP